MTETSIPHFKRWWVDRFWTEFFDIQDLNGCWLWRGMVNRAGYGRIGLDGQNYFVHRLAYMIYYRENPGELLVRHKCDTPRCCNPFHLELGTHADNSRDMRERGRSQTGDTHWTKRLKGRVAEIKKQGRYDANIARMQELNGENHPCTVLTADIVRQIKERSFSGESNRELAKAFNVTHSNISAIILGKSWAHIVAPTRGKENKYQAKLTPAQVRDIRSQVANGRAIWSIAKELKMSPTTIDKVVKRISWKHIQ